MKNAKTLALYGLSAIAVVLLALATEPSATVVGIYWSVAFWSLAGLDFYRSQVVENGASEVEANLNPAPGKFSFADRFLGYIFAAPFMLPVKAIALVFTRK